MKVLLRRYFFFDFLETIESLSTHCRCFFLQSKFWPHLQGRPLLFHIYFINSARLLITILLKCMWTPHPFDSDKRKHRVLRHVLRLIVFVGVIRPISNLATESNLSSRCRHRCVGVVFRPLRFYHRRNNTIIKGFPPMPILLGFHNMVQLDFY